MLDLDALEAVESAGVGYAGRRSDFNRLAERFLKAGTPADFERMANDRAPMTRAMGIYCLARSNAERAAAVLSARTEDAATLQIVSGCVGGETTVGHLARQLLWNRHYLDSWEEIDPLLPPHAVAAEELRLSASDEPADANRLADYGTGAVGSLLRQKRISIDPMGVEQILKHWPNGTRWQLVKGLGRLGLPDISRPVLIACLAGETEQAEVRLAAASALTRDVHPDALRAIESAGAFLDMQEPGLAARLLTASRLRAKLEPADRNSISIFSPPRDEAFRKTFQAADHPLLLEYARRGPPSIFGGGTDGADVTGSQLVALSARLPEFGRRWDTYSDAATKLGHFLGQGDSQLMTDEQRKDVRRGIARALRLKD
jgi:hypothetical protein